jgi:hypothetical protein
MRQARPEVIAGAVEEDLRLILQSTKCARMNDAGPVALKLSAISVARLRKHSSPRIAGSLRDWREDAALVCFHFFARFPLAARNFHPVRVFGHAREYLSP